jgi:cold shock CspA family protein
MAKSQASSAKKEKEKKKLEKKKEKEQRKEERKANAKAGKSLEDMMAYVDENGNITSTPPDPTRKQTAIKTDDILIGARKHDEERPTLQRTGRVTFFNSSKGYGFIKDDQTQESIFVHSNSLNSPIQENDRVSYQTERTHKGLAAVGVKKV